MRFQGLAIAGIVAVVGCFAAGPARAGEGAEPSGSAADPRLLPPPVPEAPASAAVHPTLRLDGIAPAARAYLVSDGGGPCAPPCAPPPCCAPPAPPAPCGVCRNGFNKCGCPEWHFRLSVGVWVPGMNGTAEARGLSTDVDLTPKDAIDNIDLVDFVILSGLRAEDRRWNFRLGLFYEGVSDDAQVSDTIGFDATFEQWLIEGAVGYRVAEVPLGCGDCAPCMAVQPFVGARYNSLSLEITGPLATREQDRAWTDLIVGTELIFDFRNGWWARAYGDVGGFGLSASSDMTWSLRGEVGYKFNRCFGMLLGYGVVDWDYKDGGFEWDIRQYGPYLAFTFDF